jgi:hypothetical protein
MEEIKCGGNCACKSTCNCVDKSVKPIGSPAFPGSLLVYELAIVIMLLLFICIKFYDEEGSTYHKPLEKDLD